MKYDWSWSVFLDLSSDGVHSYLYNLGLGVLWTLGLTGATAAGALVFGSILGVFRTTRAPVLNAIGATYVEIFRNIPLLVQMFLWYFVLPEVLPKAIGQAIKGMPAPWNAFVPALLCLTFYGSARIGEQMRSGIQSLPRGQLQAALALGLTPVMAYRHVVLPEAFRLMIPPLTSEFMAIVKYSSVAMTIGLLELTGQARAMQEASFHIFEAFSAATVGYLVINGCIVLAMRWLERRLAVPGLIGAAASSPARVAQS
ncbi:glutamate/aspartate transport system permease protein 2 [Azorhizobium caulinodans ORS 571]|uniref:Glutamate/aspartate transport system permease protein 2 n=1 Tax=Azorhizobium caulinodans (strain ATCC 43989 / DSM 5975 / JCM 20966 / LMG 6465 / NBRC 14845 / NCIMB 13405 / ORS 571) TaxID=438753 RepID=A8I2S3_AZOC5|nr:amino acid ABC transporter permease [Azorhizobium caulinodans]BAF87924.1 glutamate/aspartate transport system permease protein 2 [Azorhizobium caulinodans ORS 571]